MQVITPNNKQHWLELRKQVLTSTDVAALFGCSPYKTVFELWHEKHSEDIIEIEETQRMKWGKRLESSIARGVSDDLDLNAVPMPGFIVHEDLKIGSSFDWFFGTDGILEVKNVDGFQFKQGWEMNDLNDLEAPPHIELQIQHQLLVSGRTDGIIAALIGGNEVKILKRKADKNIHDAILTKVKWFWDFKDAPEPDFSRDAEFLISLNQKVEAGKILTIEDEGITSLVIQYKHHAEKEKEAKQSKDALKAQLLVTIGDVEKVKGPNFSISCGMINKEEYTVKPSSYRGFTVTLKKNKEKT